MKQLEFDFPKPYISITDSKLAISPLKTPTISFSMNCPRSTVHTVLKAMSAGLITVSDYQGNVLKVKY
jgi:hypothetical protein